MRTLVTAVLVLLPVPALAQAGPWQVLFDGKDTAAWRSFRKDTFPEQGWVVADGCLTVERGGRGGDLVTIDEFADFELRFEWRVTKGANSGVMYRVTEDGATTWMTGPEYQVLDDQAHAKLDPRNRSGALYDLHAAEGGSLRPAGEWNEGRILICAGQVEHWLNGTRIVRCGWDSADFAARIKASKFGAMPGFAKAAKGRIALQDHGDEVSYRKVKIRTLEPAGEVKLFDGKTFDGWTHHLPAGHAMADTWSLVDGTIVCTGKPAGYLRTTADYTNFVLRLQWRFSPVTKAGGNSGVLIRQIGEDKVWPKSIEAQLQAGSAGDFWNIGEFGMQTDPARTKGRNTKQVAANELPLGEWNEYEIEADHGRVELRVNGKVLNEAWECDVVAGKICLQSEGAEIHFRELRLLPIQ